MPVNLNVIVAVATGRQAAAIAAIRVSGEGCHDLVGAHCQDFEGTLTPRKMTLTWFVDPTSGRRLDQAMVVFFAQGASYTGEESAEIFCHGGPTVVDGIVDSLVRAGARRADPGEFTRRAVANGRMDLIQAEAVALLTEATTGVAVDVAIEGVSGRPSAEIIAEREGLLEILAECEASLDFDEEDGVFADLSVVRPGLVSAIQHLEAWLLEARAMRPALGDVRVALVGPPNAGKSSLFNALLGKDRAIVDSEPGTTRDVVSDGIVLSGIRVTLVDTAGIRDVGGRIEASGVIRARNEATAADVVLAVSDGCVRDFDSGGAEVDIRVLTKADIWDAGGVESRNSGQNSEIIVSVVDGRGIECLRSAIADRAMELTARVDSASAVIVGQRQVAETEMARDFLSRAVEYLEHNAPMEAIAMEIRGAVQALGSVTGSIVTEEILDKIFARFCVGK